MPPILSDNSDSEGDVSVDEIAAHKPTADPKNDESGDDDDDDEDGDPDVYVVEKVLTHKTVKGTVLYQIKWEGYDKAADLTWEPLDNLDNATAALEEYHAKIGGAPGADTKASARKKGKRAASEASSTPTGASKRARTSSRDAAKSNGGATGEHKLPSGSWENEVKRVSAIVQEDGDNQEGKRLLGLLEWHNGNKTQHTIDIVRLKLPQKLIDYFIGHLVFQSAEQDS